MKRASVGLTLFLIVLVLGIMCAAPPAAAQDDPPPTHTPTPDWTQPLTLSSGQPARIVYEVNAGDFVTGFLLFVIAVEQAFLLYALTRNRLQEG